MRSRGADHDRQVLSELAALAKQHDLAIERVDERHARPAHALDPLPLSSGEVDEIVALDREQGGIVQGIRFDDEQRWDEPAELRET